MKLLEGATPLGSATCGEGGPPDWSLEERQSCPIPVAQIFSSREKRNEHLSGFGEHGGAMHPAHADVLWAINFLFDKLVDRPSIKILHVINGLSRAKSAVKINFSTHVGRMLAYSIGSARSEAMP